MPSDACAWFNKLFLPQSSSPANLIMPTGLRLASIHTASSKVLGCNAIPSIAVNCGHWIVDIDHDTVSPPFAPQ